eukprot:3071869-Pyramimonas_sp.AAC.1
MSHNIEDSACWRIESSSLARAKCRRAATGWRLDANMPFKYLNLSDPHTISTACLICADNAQRNG